MNTPAPGAMPHPHVGGFTLIELMIALAILVILVRIAAPSFREAMMNARMTGQANDLMADLNIARSEAVKRNRTVYLCTSSNGTTCTATAWSLGWLIFADTSGDGVQNTTVVPPALPEPALKAHPALEAGNTLVVAGDGPGQPAGARYVPYKSSGVSTPGAGIVTFTMCDSRTTPLRGRLITINPTGRPLVSAVTC